MQYAGFSQYNYRFRSLWILAKAGMTVLKPLICDSPVHQAGFSFIEVGKLMVNCMSQQRLFQNLPLRTVEPKLDQGSGLAATSGMVVRQQISQDFRRRDGSVFAVGQFHFFGYALDMGRYSTRDELPTMSMIRTATRLPTASVSVSSSPRAKWTGCSLPSSMAMLAA